MFSGYKFETLSLLDEPWDSTSREFIESRENKVVNNKAQYCSVVRTGIGSSRMVIGGEVDAGKPVICHLCQSKENTSKKQADPLHAVWDCKPDKTDDPINWVELKTSLEIYNDKDLLKYERKLLKFWAQSFLLGVPKIIVGFRNEHGILQRLEELVTRDIPGQVIRQGKGTWDGNICINFTSRFLECTQACSSFKLPPLTMIKG